MIAGGFAVFAAEDTEEIEYSVVFNGVKMSFDQSPINREGRILVPMRAIFEAYGADVKWDEDNMAVTATKGNTKIELKIDKKRAYINDEKISLDVAPALVGGRTMVPIRVISEALYADIMWDESTYTVIIKTYEVISKDSASDGTDEQTAEEDDAIYTDISNISYDIGFCSTQQGIKGACYLTCLGMISSNLNDEEVYASHVYALNSKSVNQHDYYGLLSKLNIARTDSVNLKDKSDSEKISMITNLLSNNPEGIIIRFMNGTQSHYIVVKGYKDGRLVVNDPVGQFGVTLDKCWTGYSMFSDYENAVSGIVLMEAFNKGNSVFSWDFLDDSDNGQNSEDKTDENRITEV